MVFVCVADRCVAPEHNLILLLRHRNKAVLSNSPDLPLIFLMLQLLIAVILLHAFAALHKKIDLPRFDVQVAKKLVPVVLVNIIGLVFNTLCLRDVEASFFQVKTCALFPW
jgi:GDP-fucose transporter C1